MGNHAQIICQLTFKHEKALQKLCLPLLQIFGLDTFWYYTLTKEGELTYVSNNPLIADYFYSSELYKGHPYFRAPQFIPSGFFFSEKASDKAYIETQGKMRERFSLDQIFMVMKNSGSKVEGYGFATTQDLPDLTSSIINNLFLFRKFINYFHTESIDLIKQMNRHSIDIAAECGNSFYSPPTHFTELDRAKISKFNFATLASLSPREKECLKWFVRGMSASQIGKQIHLSPRTIESHIESIKNKLGCHTKKELFEFLLDSPDFLKLVFFP